MLASYGLTQLSGTVMARSIVYVCAYDVLGF